MSNTIDDLKTAFAGESQAFQKYTAYAKKAVADGLGLSIDVKNSQGVMVVNVGYSTTEISILSLGGIVLSKLIKVGGYRFDDAIRNGVRKEYNLIFQIYNLKNI